MTSPEQRPIITLLTDFGEGSSYVAEMKGVILTLNSEANLIDLTHGIVPQDIRGGAYALQGVFGRFPANTIHVVVVDPGVGTDRDIVCARMNQQFFIAPDNGVLSLVAESHPPESVIALRNREFWLSEVSSTFHGRDIMAPAAAYLSLGQDPDQLGPPKKRLVELAWPKVRVEAHRVRGTIVSFDSFGNLVTDISRGLLKESKAPKHARVHCADEVIVGLTRTYKNQPPQSLIALIGSRGMLEIAVVNGSAIERLGVDVGEEVEVVW